MEEEFVEHIIDTINDYNLTSFEDLHHYAFNESLYIAGEYNSEQWLKKYNIPVLDAIRHVAENYRKDFGEALSVDDISAEYLVNFYVYYESKEFLNNFNLNSLNKEELIEELKKFLDYIV